MSSFDLFNFPRTGVEPGQPRDPAAPVRLLVVSDTHGDQAGLAAALKAIGRRVDLLVHLGDGVADLSLALGGLKQAPEYEFACGSGEEPFERQAPRLIEAGGAKILLLHGHQHGVREGYGGLLSTARAFDAGIVLFGHTHEAMFETLESVLLINPGSLGKPKKPGFPTFALLAIKDGRGAARLFALRPGVFGPRVEPWHTP